MSEQETKHSLYLDTYVNDLRTKLAAAEAGATALLEELRIKTDTIIDLGKKLGKADTELQRYREKFGPLYFFMLQPQEEALLRAAEYLLDDVRKMETRVMQLGDPPHLVQSEVSKMSKLKAEHAINWWRWERARILGSPENPWKEWNR